MTSDGGPTADDAGATTDAETNDGIAAPEAETDGHIVSEADENDDSDADGHIVSTYAETDGERRLTFDRAVGSEGDGGGSGAECRTVVAQPLAGYAMLTVRDGDGQELERYYGFDMAIDHAADRLGVPPATLPVPDEASDMGM